MNETNTADSFSIFRPVRIFASMIYFALFAIASTSISSSASTIDFEDDHLIGFDSIVRSLDREVTGPSQQTLRGKVSRSQNDPFENVAIHFGVGVSSIMQKVDMPNGQQWHLNQRGFQAALGIDLLSPNWMAEGTARSFGQTDDPSTKIALKEFELKVFYKSRFTRSLGLRAGGGLAARYMTVHDGERQTFDYTTPASVATLGFDLYLSEGLSLGADISTRNTMIAETIDQNSYDATLRMDTHF